MIAQHEIARLGHPNRGRWIRAGTDGRIAYRIATGNIAFVTAQNLILAFLALLSPVFVGFLLGRGGIGTFASAVTTVGSGLAFSVGASALPYLAKQGASGGGLLSRAAGRA